MDGKKATECLRPFSISLPPPNTTGTLHMGHAVMLAIEDIMVRYARMTGRKTLWVPGTDHAAIATESKVDKDNISATGKSKHDLGRDAFLKKVDTYVKSSQGIIKNQMRSSFVLLFASTKNMIFWLRGQPYARKSYFENFEKIATRWDFEHPPNWFLRVYYYLRTAI